MGQIPLAAFFENGHMLFVFTPAGVCSAGEPGGEAVYTLSLFRHGRESKTDRNFPKVSVSSST